MGWTACQRLAPAIASRHSPTIMVGVGLREPKAALRFGFRGAVPLVVREVSLTLTRGSESRAETWTHREVP